MADHREKGSIQSETGSGASRRDVLRTLGTGVAGLVGVGVRRSPWYTRPILFGTDTPSARLGTNLELAMQDHRSGFISP